MSNVINLPLTGEQLDYIVRCLYRRPFEEVDALIKHMRDTVAAHNAAQEKKEE